jgi:hypothetical protein
MARARTTSILPNVGRREMLVPDVAMGRNDAHRSLLLCT